MVKAEVKEEVEENKELKSKIQAGNAIIGNSRVVKALQAGKIKTVFIAKNCPTKIRDDLLYYAKLAGAEVVGLEQNNEELGTICKKNFFVSVVGTN